MTVIVKPNQPVIVVPPPTQAKVVVGGTPTNVVIPPSTQEKVVVGESPTNIVVPQGRGAQGDPGPPGPGTTVVAVSNDEWPPTDPQPNTLYLRLAP